MNLIEPCPWACPVHKKRVKLYADGVIWCEECGKALKDTEAVNVARGKQRNTPSPKFKPVRVD